MQTEHTTLLKPNVSAGVFNDIYATDAWAVGSGPGSLRATNAPFMNFLEMFIRNNRIAKFVDFGCGDWQWMSKFDLGRTEYTGLDVVDSVLTANSSKYVQENVFFARTPERLSDLPEGDLILFKDVFIHLPNDYVAEALVQASRKFRYIIAVNNFIDNPTKYNGQIEFGGFRPVDISLPPFSVPCATVLRFGTQRILDPRRGWLVAFLTRRFVWPGLKHVQLAFGSKL